MAAEGAHESVVVCPSCGASFDVSEILYTQIEKEVRDSIDTQFAGERKTLKVEREKLEHARKALDGKQEALDEDIKAGVAEHLKSAKKDLEQRIRAAVKEERSEQFETMQEELERKSEEVKELNKTKAQIEKLKREKEELKDKVEAEAQKRLNETLQEEKVKLEERMELKLGEKEGLIEQLRKQLQDAQRRAEQGSIQLQGETQELAIEEWLRGQFPLDVISEVKKGAKGADCLQVVNTAAQQACGSVYYESKRTKAFQPGWIEKLKADMRARGADIGVIVTQAMPKNMVRMGQKDGVWICGFEEFKGLCLVLRESLVQVSDAIISQENKGGKMSMLYDYLTSNEFRMQVEAIVEGFVEMQSDLDKERRAMENAWKRREKQIDKVLLNTNHMYSSIRGIAGNAVSAVPQLEFSDQQAQEGPE